LSCCSAVIDEVIKISLVCREHLIKMMVPC
jgi:hypothetical protein